MSRKVIAVAIILVALVTPVAIGLSYLNSELSHPVGRDALFEIPAGDNLSSIALRLEKRDLSPTGNTFFKAYALVTRDKGQIKAGQYQITREMTLAELLALFRSGRVVQHRVTFPEGWTFSQWRQRLQEAPYLNVTSADKSDDEIVLMLGLAGSIEGRVFPDTYTYTLGDADIDIIKRAVRRMDDVLAAEWGDRVPNLASSYEALILASIIEKETGNDADRDKIASVFHNRLTLNMKLQSDPTVIYGLGASFDGDLKRSHLKTDSPYNTYMRRGLPITPICSPGLASIRAAMTGSAHPYLYFVARGDGTSQFSETLEQHNAAVRTYQLGISPESRP